MPIKNQGRTYRRLHNQIHTFLITDVSITPTNGTGLLTINITGNLTNFADTDGQYWIEIYINSLKVAGEWKYAPKGQKNTLPVPVHSHHTQVIPGQHQQPTGTTVKVLRGPEFLLDNLNVTPRSGWEPLTINISAEISNRGDTAAEYTATLYINGVAAQTKTATVAAGKTVTVTFNHELTSTGSYTFGIGSLTPKTATVMNEPIISDITVTPGQGAAPLYITVTARISTMESGAGDYTTILYVDGVAVQTRTVRVTGPGTTVVTFNTMINEPGTHTVRINNHPDVTVRALRPASFELNDLQVTPVEGIIPLNIEVSARITNTGELSGTYTARLYIDGALVETKSFSVLAGSQATVTFRKTITERGIHNVWIDTIPPVSVNATRPATLNIKDFAVTPITGTAPVTATITATLENTGDYPGTFNINILQNGATIHQQTITLNPQETRTIILQTQLTTPGTYNYSINNADYRTVYVNPQEDLQVHAEEHRKVHHHSNLLCNNLLINRCKARYRTFKFTLKPGASYSRTIGYYPSDARIVTTRKLYNPSRYSRTIRISETFRADSITATDLQPNDKKIRLCNHNEDIQSG